MVEPIPETVAVSHQREPLYNARTMNELDTRLLPIMELGKWVLEAIGLIQIGSLWILYIILQAIVSEHGKVYNGLTLFEMTNIKYSSVK